jgi:small subunit ribosomal protein S2
MKALLESGVHFGHRTNKWHPSMKPYIFTERNNIHIIDLQQTVKALGEAYNLVRDTVAEGGTVLFVGTKRQAQETIEIEAMRCEMPYVIYRWLGGMLTNWRTIRERLNELERLERMRDAGDFERITKKEALNLNRKIDRLDMLLGGVRNMGSQPALLFAVDVRREETAIHEANLLKIPVVAMVDTNCDPRDVDYIIPSNDDAIRAIKLLVGKIADAVLEGKAMRKEDEELEEAKRIEMPAAEEEVELSDEELLGEATLAKISASTQPEVDSEAIEEAKEIIADQIEAVEEAEEIIADEIVAVAEAEETIVEEVAAVVVAEEIIAEEIEVVEAAKEIIAEEIIEGDKPVEEITEEIAAVAAAEEVIVEEIVAVEEAKEIIVDQIEEATIAEEIIAEQIEEVIVAEEVIAEEIEAVEAAEEETIGEDDEQPAEDED